MTKDHCPLGDDCDLLIAYKHGISSAKDIIVGLEAERDKLREAMMRACDLIDDAAEGKTGLGTPYRMLAAALQETEK